MAKTKIVSSKELDSKKSLRAQDYFESNDLKPLTEEQQKALIAAVRAWKAQGSRSKWSTGPSIHLWDMVDEIEKRNTRRKWSGEGDPRVGEDVYVDSQSCIDHGWDDFRGGLVQVSKVYESMSSGEMVTFIEVVERPGHVYNWEHYLKDKQEALAAQYGSERGRPNYT